MDPEHVLDLALRRPVRHLSVGLRNALQEQAPDLSWDDATRTFAAMQMETARDAYRLIGELRAFLKPYETHHSNTNPDVVVFWPEDFVSFFLDLAEVAGIDLEEWGQRLDPAAKHPEYVVGFAFRALCEVEQIYVEYPEACTEFRVPRAFLLSLAAAMVGIATKELAEIDTTAAAALSGIGSVLLSIIANRWTHPADVQTDFLEELVLRTLDEQGGLTVGELAARTHIHRPLLNRVIRRLITKGLVRERRKFSGDRQRKIELAP